MLTDVRRPLGGHGNTYMVMANLVGHGNLYMAISGHDNLDMATIGHGISGWLGQPQHGNPSPVISSDTYCTRLVTLHVAPPGNPGFYYLVTLGTQISSHL